VVTQEDKIDFLLLDGNVVSLDVHNTRAQALAAREGKIVAIGTSDELSPMAGERTHILNAKGKTVVPGFIESHNHFLSHGLLMSQIDCSTPPNIHVTDILEKLAKKARTTPEGEWVLGTNYDDTLLAEMRHPTREELDEAAPKHPVYLRHVTGHVGAVNSIALDAAGFDKNTPDPSGGCIVRDPVSGELTGLVEESANNIMRQLAFRPGLKEMRAALMDAQKEYLKMGVTSVHDLGFAEGGCLMARAYQEVVVSGALKISIYLTFRDHQLSGLFTSPRTDIGFSTGFGNDSLRIGALKLIQDGSIQAWTGALGEPYLGKSHDCTGYLWMNQNELDHKVLAGHEAGFQVAIHCNGDRAIESALSSIAYAQSSVSRPDSRHRLEHCQLATDKQLDKMIDMGVVASFFVQHTYYWGDRHMNIFLGPQRARRIDPLNSALKRGLIFALHSDCPVTPVNPIFGIWSAVNRQTRDGHILGPEERIAPLDALRAFTINAAYLSFDEKKTGSLEIGKQADMVVLSDDPTSVDPKDIKEITVEKTIIKGNIVYDSSH